MCGALPPAWCNHVEDAAELLQRAMQYAALPLAVSADWMGLTPTRQRRLQLCLPAWCQCRCRRERQGSSSQAFWSSSKRQRRQQQQEAFPCGWAPCPRRPRPRTSRSGIGRGGKHVGAQCMALCCSPTRSRVSCCLVCADLCVPLLPCALLTAAWPCLLLPLLQGMFGGSGDTPLSSGSLNAILDELGK